MSPRYKARQKKVQAEVQFKEIRHNNSNLQKAAQI